MFASLQLRRVMWHGQRANKCDARCTCATQIGRRAGSMRFRAAWPRRSPDSTYKMFSMVCPLASSVNSKVLLTSKCSTSFGLGAGGAAVDIGLRDFGFVF
jgi:hypothetical protein